MIKTKELAEEIDRDWMALMIEAKKMGISKEIVREFLNQNDIREAICKNPSTT
ncbi:anti-repressor SinI family protein [Neobacillus sp. SM06]|uniref:anti-repressor SinI family protein n=1 Tax=Neobacillus sp. SM06 TaxID=3422492 RepID=UPI003D2E334A